MTEIPDPALIGENIRKSGIFIGREDDGSLQTLQEDWQKQALELGLTLKPASRSLAFRYMSSLLLGRVLSCQTELDRVLVTKHGLHTPDDILAYAYQDQWFDAKTAGQPLMLTGTAFIHRFPSGGKGTPKHLFLGVAFRGHLPSHPKAHLTVHAERSYFSNTFDPHSRGEKAATFPYVLLGRLSAEDVQKTNFSKFVRFAESSLPADVNFSQVLVSKRET